MSDEDILLYLVAAAAVYWLASQPSVPNIE